MKVFLSLDQHIKKTGIDINEFLSRAKDAIYPNNGIRKYVIFTEYAMNGNTPFTLGFMIIGDNPMENYSEIIEINISTTYNLGEVILKIENNSIDSESIKTFGSSFETLKEDMKEFGFKLDWPFIDKEDK